MFDEDEGIGALVIGIVLFIITCIASHFYSPWDSGERTLNTTLLMYGVTDIYDFMMCSKAEIGEIFNPKTLTLVSFMTIQNLLFYLISKKYEIENLILRCILGYLYENIFSYFTCVISWNYTSKIWDFFYSNANNPIILGILIILSIAIFPEILHAGMYFFSLLLYQTVYYHSVILNVTTEAAKVIFALIYVIIAIFIIELIMDKISELILRCLHLID
ncbi:MAG: hypothetical protein V3G42_10040 [Oscillospiraceae bacterium]